MLTLFGNEYPPFEPSNDDENASLDESWIFKKKLSKIKSQINLLPRMAKQEPENVSKNMAENNTIEFMFSFFFFGVVFYTFGWLAEKERNEKK